MNGIDQRRERLGAKKDLLVGNRKAISMPPAPPSRRSPQMPAISAELAMVKRKLRETFGTIERKSPLIKLPLTPALRAIDSCISQLAFRPAVRENQASDVAGNSWKG